MKPTTIQLAILARIEAGIPREFLADGIPVTRDENKQIALVAEPHTLASYQWSKDGEAILAHRTILTTDTGNPRLDYRVEMFRIFRDGRINRL